MQLHWANHTLKQCASFHLLPGAVKLDLHQHMTLCLRALPRRNDPPKKRPRRRSSEDYVRDEGAAERQKDVDDRVESPLSMIIGSRRNVTSETGDLVSEVMDLVVNLYPQESLLTNTSREPSREPSLGLGNGCHGEEGEARTDKEGKVETSPEGVPYERGISVSSSIGPPIQLVPAEDLGDYREEAGLGAGTWPSGGDDGAIAEEPLAGW